MVQFLPMDKDLVPSVPEQRKAGITPRLSNRELKLIENLQKPDLFPTIVSAAEDAGYSESTARSYIATHLQKPRFQRGKELVESKQRDRGRTFLEIGREGILRLLQSGACSECGRKPDMSDRELLAAHFELYRSGQKDRETVGDADPDGIQAMSSSLDRVRLLQAQCVLAGIDAAQRFRRPLLERWARRLRRQVRELEDLLA